MRIVEDCSTRMFGGVDVTVTVNGGPATSLKPRNALLLYVSISAVSEPIVTVFVIQPSQAWQPLRAVKVMTPLAPDCTSPTRHTQMLSVGLLGAPTLGRDTEPT